MSDVEEPPTKMSKYEEYLEEASEECLEEGQEEWLSEGVLTDDDYHITETDQEAATVEHANETMDNDTIMSQNMEAVDQSHEAEKGNDDHVIEDTLNNLDGKNSLPEDLDAFLVRKTEVQQQPPELKVNEEKIQNDVKEDDGNDTDDLLRLLEDGQQVKKKSIKIVKTNKAEDQDSSDDDEFIYDHSKVKTLKLAKNALIKRAPTKAVPEQMSDSDDETDASSDEGTTMKKMFGVRSGGPPRPLVKVEQPRKVVKHVVQVNTNFNKIDKPKSNFPKSILKPTPSKPKIETRVFKHEVKTPTPFKPLVKKTHLPVKLDAKLQEKKLKIEENREKNMTAEELDEIIDEEEFLEEDDFDLDEEEFGEESEGEISKRQRIMKPEMMDEEVPSDDDSHSEDGSLYDELPSSDSEDFDDWFTLDVRAERAADYLPLLGTCAGALLSAERRRAVGRVATLRHSLSALTDSARRQADALRHAAMALAEIDDTLRAA